MVVAADGPKAIDRRDTHSRGRVGIGGAAEVNDVHQELFGKIRPAAAMVQVSALIDPSLLIEIEVDASR
jgi:enamine deaminase RidA (YjgF/YER057c/UK114 family)